MLLAVTTATRRLRLQSLLLRRCMCLIATMQHRSVWHRALLHNDVTQPAVGCKRPLSNSTTPHTDEPIDAAQRVSLARLEKQARELAQCIDALQAKVRASLDRFEQHATASSAGDIKQCHAMLANYSALLEFLDGTSSSHRHPPHAAPLNAMVGDALHVQVASMESKWRCRKQIPSNWRVKRTSCIFDRSCM
jgi:hypothetical protein